MPTHLIKRLYYPVFLLLVCFIAYLPLSSFLFAPKNDAYIYNFPNKYFFSECLRNGHLPTWNPYLNFGFPLHADPGFAWWHPITWIFGLIGYNAYTFSIEILLYIYIGGLGMYWLGRVLSLHNKTAFAIACMFMCSGFFIGNLQHVNFLTGAAFIPWLTGSWLLYQQVPSNKHLLFNGMSAYLLFTAGHPAIPIATIYFLACLTILYFILFRNQNRLAPFMLNQVKLLGVVLIFLFPLTYSYTAILPYYSRSETVNQLASLNVGFTLPSFISFFLPFATIKNTEWFSTDVSMRNAYFSLLGASTFMLFLFQRSKEKRTYLFLIAGLFMLLLSAGGWIKEVVYEHLPGLQLIRTNGEFRVFTIFCFILCASYPMNLLFTNNNAIAIINKKLFTWIITTLLLLIITISFNTKVPQLQLVTGSLTEGIKQFLEQITFIQTFIIALIATLGLSALYWCVLRNKKVLNLLIFVLVIDLIVNSWLLLPITGVGKTSVATMQSVINKSPEGFPVPSITATSNTSSQPISQVEELLIGNWAWYDKQITHAWIEYPSQLKSTSLFANSKDSLLLSDAPFLHLKKQETESLNITAFTPSSLKLKAELPHKDTLVFLQNSFKGWHVTIDQSPAKHFIYSGTFMAVPLDKGTHSIEWRYTPSLLKILLIWSLLLILLYSVSKLVKQRHPA